MTKKLLALSLVLMIAVGFSACKVDKNDTSGKKDDETTQRITKIYNSFKDTLPDFSFDSKPVENYVEGISYSFSAECTEKDFDKYIEAVQKTGYDVKPVEGKGYYKAHNAEKYFVEAVLVDGMITVFVKR